MSGRVPEVEVRIGERRWTAAAPGPVLGLRWDDHAERPGGVRLELSAASPARPGLGARVELAVGDRRAVAWIGGWREVRRPGRHVVEVRAGDVRTRLASGPRHRSFASMQDGQVVRQVLDDAGLTEVDVAPMAVWRDAVVQEGETDLALVQRIARRHGLMVGVDGACLRVIRPAYGDAVVPIAPEQVRSLDLVVDAVGLPTGLTVVGFDPVAGRAVRAQVGASDADVAGEGRHATAWAAEVVGLHHRCDDPDVRAVDEARTLAAAELARRSRALLRGVVQLGWRPELRVGDRLRLDGVGPAGSLVVLVVGVQHRWRAGEEACSELQVCADALPAEVDDGLRASAPAGVALGTSGGS